ncbi:DUF3742 family protein [Pseudomonas sp. FME51]|uniref:DUF3742 family protein n=1 Tax=Pseudomonas sp. FME51 TaxID=2742609 RepID=UPI0018674B42|nr:DUF3742 family protein [Pseudomonas sp. FME51]
MNTITPHNGAERFGRWLGRRWSGFVRSERRLAAWLVNLGVSKTVANTLLWVPKLVFLAALLYVAFWLTILLVAAVIVSWAAHERRTPDDEDSAEWRIGFSGYGLYRGETRVDAGLSDDEV